jgi:hypothetical protein
MAGYGTAPYGTFPYGIPPELLPLGDWDSPYPDIIFEVEFTPDVWTDLSAKVRGPWNVTRGRSRELDKPEAGRATVVLDAYDRALEAGNKASPYWPNVRPLKRCRLHGLVDGVRVPLFTNWFIEKWGGAWPENGFDQTTTLTIGDGFTVLSRIALDIYDDEVLADKPDVYFRLDEPVGTVAIEGTGGPGSVATGALGIEGSPLVGGTTVYEAATAPGTVVGAGGAGMPPPIISTAETGTYLPGTTFEFWLYLTQLPSGAPALMLNPKDHGGGDLGTLYLSMDGTGKISVYGNNYPTVTDASWVIPLGQWTHVVAIRRLGIASLVELYMNGAKVGPSVASTAPAFSTFAPGGQLQIGASYNGGEVICGRFARVASYSYPLDPARIYAHHQAMLGGIGPMASGEQIDTLLDECGWDPSDRDIDAGYFALAAFTPKSPPIDDLLNVSASEGGLVFHAPNGDMTFFDSTHEGRSGAAFGTATGEILFENVTFDYDDVQLYNKMTVQAPNLPNQTITDKRSEDRYFVRGLPPIDTLMLNAIDMGKKSRRLLVAYSEPKQRIVGIDHVNSQADWANLLDYELLDVVTVNVTPPGGGAPISQDSRIERISINSNSRQDWHIHWDLSAVPRVNMLDDDQASPDTTTAGWAAESNCTLVQGSVAVTGRYSLAMFAVAAGTMKAITTPTWQIPVKVGEPYIASAFFRGGTTGAVRACHVEISWRGLTGAELSASVGAAITDIDTGWTAAWCEGVAPAGAVYACVRLVVASALLGEAHFADLMILSTDE